MHRLLSFLAIPLLLAWPVPGHAFSPEARGTAMGGSFSQFASGAEGLWWNQAVLNRPSLLSAVLGGGLEGGNNALTINRIVGIVENNATAKSDAVKDIKAKGKWEARIEAGGAAGITVLGVGLGVFPHALVSAEDVSPDAAEYALNGAVPLVAGRHYLFKGTFTRAVYTDIVAGYSHALPTFIPGVSLDAGGGLKYILGTDYDYVKTVQDFTTGPGPVPSSDSRHVTASQGAGFAADLGLQGSILGAVKASITARNLGAKITWKNAAVQSGYFDQSTLKFVSTTKYQDESQTLPTIISAGAGGTIPIVGTSVGVQGDYDTTHSEFTAHLGVEQSIAGILAFRAGYRTGAGPAPAQVTFGLGVGAIIAHLDLGGGLALNGKGGSAAISANLNI